MRTNALGVALFVVLAAACGDAAPDAPPATSRPASPTVHEGRHVVPFPSAPPPPPAPAPAWPAGPPASPDTYLPSPRFTLPPSPEAMYVELEQGDLPSADALLEGIWPARGHDAVKLAEPLAWTEDPYADAYWRFMFYGLRYTTHLSWAFGETGDVRYADKLVAILRSYVAADETRAFDRLTFDNEHASAYRAMVLVNHLVKLEKAGRMPVDLRPRIEASLGRIATYLMDPKRFESWANHGFAEAAALLVVAHNVPSLPGAAGFRKTGIERLETMRATNVDADGVDIENSPFYHLFVLGIVAQVARWCAAYEPALAPAYTTTKRQMIHYVAYVTQPDGRLPMLGATATTIVPNQDPTVYGPLSDFDPEYAWVFTRGQRGAPPSKPLERFPSSGLFVLRAAEPSLAQTFVTFDAGTYRTDHSHLDALSVTLYAEGTAIFPDAGLYTYDKGTAYDYFHGTRAHNTVVVDGKDQIEGAATPGPSGVSDGAAWATGTSTLAVGVTHSRTVIVIEQGVVLVVDDLASSGEHLYEQTWHAFAGAGVTRSGPDVTITNAKGGTMLLVRQADAASLAITDVVGQTAPMQGWLSSAYGSMVPGHAITYARRGSTATFATLLVSGPTRTSKPATATQDGAGTVRICAGGKGAIVGRAAGIVTVTRSGC